MRDANTWVLAYRVVLPDLVRRIALCRLNDHFEVVPGSAIPFSDLVEFPSIRQYAGLARTWFADPRLFRLGERLFIYWNSGWHDSLNSQFIQELETATVLPRGKPRELILEGERQQIEKNWTFFGSGPFYAVYSINPHRILQFSLGGDADVSLADAQSTSWNNSEYSQEYGALRGGAPPQPVGAGYYSFCHSVSNSPEGHRYVTAVYRFAGTFPFRPTHAPAKPLDLGNPFGARPVYPRLNPVVGEVLYTSGAVFKDGLWTISYGINDEHCAIGVLSHDEVEQSLCELTSEA